MTDTKKTPAQLAASLQKEVRDLSTVFTSKNFLAIIEISCETHDGGSFRTEIVLDEKDPEFKKMINDYAARKSAAILSLMDSARPVITC